MRKNVTLGWTRENAFKYPNKSKIFVAILCLPGVGVTEAPFVNFSVNKIFDPVKVPVRLFASHSYLTGVTEAELRQHLSNMNVIYNS